MKIDISPKELQTLRGEAHERLQWLRNTPAGQSQTVIGRSPVAEQIRVLEKFIRKMNRALVKVHGHDCCACLYE
jgi:hypothetical protein